MEDTAVAVLARTILAMGIVVGLIYAAAFGFRRWQGFSLLRVAGGAPRRLRVLETVRLGPDAGVHLVSVDGRTLLIGSGRGHVPVVLEEMDLGENARVVGTGDRRPFVAHLQGAGHAGKDETE
ncbi:MAG: flagellar biosynthetic protein FliO [Firmicutes bacterium]|nr:flagellar biosynthetic protein FliO [Bacillota bacterium]